jgi:hypothetical protein
VRAASAFITTPARMALLQERAYPSCRERSHSPQHRLCHLPGIVNISLGVPFPSISRPRGHSTNPHSASSTRINSRLRCHRRANLKNPAIPLSGHRHQQGGKPTYPKDYPVQRVSTSTSRSARLLGYGLSVDTPAVSPQHPARELTQPSTVHHGARSLSSGPRRELTQRARCQLLQRGITF